MDLSIAIKKVAIHSLLFLYLLAYIVGVAGTIGGCISENNISSPISSGLAMYSPSTGSYTLDRMYSLAHSKIKDLVNTDNFMHTNSDGCDLECRVNKEALSGWYGENLYSGPCDIRNALYMWEKSPTHKEILDSKYVAGIIIIYPQKGQSNCYIVMDITK